MRCFSVHRSGGSARQCRKSRQYGNATTTSDHRNPNPSAAGRARALCARPFAGFHRIGGADPRCALVRVLPHLRRKIRASLARTVIFPTIFSLPIWFGVFPETGIAQDDPTARAAASRTRGSAIGKVFGVKSSCRHICAMKISLGGRPPDGSHADFSSPIVDFYRWLRSWIRRLRVAITPARCAILDV
jgi:hypothetical protein